MLEVKLNSPDKWTFRPEPKAESLNSYSILYFTSVLHFTSTWEASGPLITLTVEIVHIVLFKLKARAAEEGFQTAKQAINALKQVPGAETVRLDLDKADCRCTSALLLLMLEQKVSTMVSSHILI